MAEVSTESCRCRMPPMAEMGTVPRRGMWEAGLASHLVLVGVVGCWKVTTTADVVYKVINSRKISFLS